MRYFYRLICIIPIFAMISASYLELKLVRTAVGYNRQQSQPINCINQSSISVDAGYRQICYQKDISYVIDFIKKGQIRQHFSLAADFTTPISWTKGKNCTIASSNTKCTSLTQTLAQNIVHKKEQIFNKSNIDEPVNVMIEVPSEIIRGEIKNGISLSFTTKDSNRVNNVFQLMMLGLFIYGQRDTLPLQNTNFIEALSISSRLDLLMDGAISLRYDQTAENSFLHQIFTYVKTVDKTVTVFLGVDNTITIGDMTAKYTKTGYSSINWINMPDDQGYGKLAYISNIAIDDTIDDSGQGDNETLPAIITISASYIGLPEQVINSVLIQSFSKTVLCKIDDKTLFVQCWSSNKKKLQRIIKNNLIFGFSGLNMMIPIKKLVLINDDDKILFNIKKTHHNRVILGEPIFLQYFMAFDYHKNMIGFGPKKQQFEESLFGVVSLVRFMCTVLVMGCAFIIYYSACLKQRKIRNRRGVYSSQKKILRQYSPIKQNSFEDSKGKNQQVNSSSEQS